ncbi:uncharacterized protein PV09_09574 [Verruconis gallopava]|uniref:Uncharacterized protein n=1 Tax=Verruconis gallopava TaxID=253628 RepID=A0A0D1YD42_9PEZI|nr:uncharacterized protein PV09_09574 [Verruconis gallopava]KIV98626.1 hypothetical protein PV09_09574 [Verruconis gallopava]
MISLSYTLFLCSRKLIPSEVVHIGEASRYWESIPNKKLEPQDAGVDDDDNDEDDNDEENEDKEEEFEESPPGCAKPVT